MCYFAVTTTPPCLLFQFIKSKIRNRLHHTRAEKSQFVAINRRLSKALDEEDEGFGYCTWKHDEDEMYDSFLKEALAEQDKMDQVIFLLLIAGKKTGNWG